MTSQRNTLSMGRRIGPAILKDDLQRRLSNAIRIYRAAVPEISRAESQLLADIACKGDGITMFSKLLNVGARARCEQESLAVVNAVYQHVLWNRSMHERAPLSLVEVLLLETASNGPANEAQEQFIISPSRATAERVTETLSAQLHATQGCLKAVTALDFEKPMPSFARLTA